MKDSEMDILRTTDDDRELNARLMAQPRPVRPGSLREARRQVELLVALGLSQTLSHPEANVAATQVTGWFEDLVQQEVRPWDGGAHSVDGGETVVLETARGGVSVTKDKIPDLISILEDAVSAD